jgi:hypothetical protein
VCVRVRACACACACVCVCVCVCVCASASAVPFLRNVSQRSESHTAGKVWKCDTRLV